jgi:hypothetical protein
MKHKYILNKEVHTELPDEPFEENLKPLLRFDEHVSMQVQEKYGEISVFSVCESGDYPNKRDEREHFRFKIKFKQRFLEFMEVNGRKMKTDDGVNYTWSYY